MANGFLLPPQLCDVGIAAASPFPDLGQRVELPHEARVEVHRRVQPAVRVHSLDLGAVLGVLEEEEERKSAFSFRETFPISVGQNPLSPNQPK